MTHIYLMPGMAANSTIFEHIELPPQAYQLHRLDWFIPSSEETLSSYARKMAAKVVHQKAVLIGVSFGGILVQEMANFLDLKKLIIVSSVKSNREFPRRFILSRKLKLYKILPTQLFEDVDKLAKYAFGETVKNRMALYQKYLSMNDKVYLDWAIKEMICWEQETPPEGVIHIHGDADRIFPKKYIDDCITISGGTHIMILTKYKWFNKNLPQLIENT